ncbi:hypothetical protein Q3G72_017228 [Acer saccharum]|nr:hypothetical protein Q3G72_013522 [Acer saccharum]KAK1548593.1 hypothetical protein Q3G72_017228 [Acer saccharum]
MTRPCRLGARTHAKSSWGAPTDAHAYGRRNLRTKGRARYPGSRRFCGWRGCRVSWLGCLQVAQILLKNGRVGVEPGFVDLRRPRGAHKAAAQVAHAVAYQCAHSWYDEGQQLAHGASGSSGQ